MENGMRSIIFAAGILSSSLLFGKAAAHQKTATSTEAIQLIRSLEKSPLANEAKATRSKLIDWATETDDVSILTCDVLGPIPGSKVPHGPELLAQAMFGNGAFQLEHPESKGDEVKAQLAGIESMLRAYAKILESEPGARIPLYDTWLEEMKAGTLEARLAPNIREKCTEAAPKA